MAYKIQYKNLFSTIPDLTKSFFHLVHYMKKANEAKTGCYFVYNLDMLLFNVALFKRTLKASTKKAEDVLYYPFGVKHFVEINPTPKFVDFIDNKKVQDGLKQYDTEKLIKIINKDFNKMKTNKLSKEDIVDLFQHIENVLLLLIKTFSVYVKTYEEEFDK